MIKNIVLDVGNVLAGFEWEQVFRRLFPQKERFASIVKSTVLSKEWDEFDRSTKSDEEIIQSMIHNSPQFELEIRQLMECVGEMIILYPDSIAWIKELKKQGFQVYILSNYSKTAYELTKKEQLYFLEMVDGAVFSFEEGYVKPEIDIYKRLLKKYQLKAEECLFFDDKEINIEAARTIGMHGIVYKNRMDAKNEMKQYIRA